MVHVGLETRFARLETEVELGFTPCAWCSPDRTLSARHRAPAR